MMSLRRLGQHLFAGLLGAALSLLASSQWSEPPLPTMAATVDSAPYEELERLRAELATLRNHQPTTLRELVPPVDADAHGDTRSTPPRLDERDLLDRLYLILDEQRQTGALRTYYASRTTELAELLLRVFVETDAPERAFDLLLAYDDRLPKLAQRYRCYVATALRETNSPRTIDAYLFLLHHQIDDSDAIAALAELAPAAALAALDTYANQHPDDPKRLASLQDERIRLLFAGKQTAAALALLEGMLNEENVPQDLFAALLEHRPERAVSALDAWLERATDEDQRANLRQRRIDALLRAGNLDLARTELAAMRADEPDSDRLLQLLARLDPAAAESERRTRFAREPNDNNALALTRVLRARGLTAEAESIEWQAFVARPDNDTMHTQLLAANSLPLAERMLLHARGLPRPPKDFDELLGNIADVLERHGQRDRAVALWREASRIQPDDEEWERKLADVAAGRNPVAPVRSDWWRGEDDGM